MPFSPLAGSALRISLGSASTAIHSPAGSLARIWVMIPSPFKSSGPSSSTWSSESSLTFRAFRPSESRGFLKKRAAPSGLPFGRINQVRPLAAPPFRRIRSARCNAASVEMGKVPSMLARTSTAGTFRGFLPSSGPISRTTSSAPPALTAILWSEVVVGLALTMAASAALTSCGEWYRSKVKVVCCCARATGPPAHTTDPAVSASVSSRRHDRGMNPSRCRRPMACGLWPMAWLGACPCPLQVLAACHLHPDRLAGRDEGRHHDLHAVLEARFLPDVVVALRVHGRRGVGDLDLDDVGEGNAHGLAVEELHREDHPLLQVAHRAPEAVVPDRHLLVGLGVHEVAGDVVAVQELHVL